MGGNTLLTSNNLPSTELLWHPRKAVAWPNPSLKLNPAGLLGRTRRSVIICVCRAIGRRSVRHNYYEEEDDDDEEEYGYNEEIGELEEYTRAARGEALIVHSVVDRKDVELVIFKGFSSSLSHETWADPSKSVLPARAEIRRIDRIRGPFHPSEIDYIERDVPWDAFRARIKGLPT